MNNKIISLAVASALVTPVIAQASEPTLYGRLHMSYGQVTEESGGTTTTDNWQVRSHASRLGVKGARDFGDGLMEELVPRPVVDIAVFRLQRRHDVV